jgi:ribosomal protein S18 acetylase RimI-like enzyme
MSSTISNIQLPELDAAHFSQLDADFIKYAWNQSQWESLDSKLDYLWADGSNGFILCRYIPSDTQFHLLKIGLKSDLRGSGLAAELMQVAFDFFRAKGVEQCYLEVEQDNKRAVGFYNKLGFKKVHLKEGFYTDGQSALMMLKTL